MDLNYFKYDFLKFTGIHFNEMDLEKDFNTLTEYLLEANSFYFMYRDFQSRNIIIHENKTWFIDYQGGRKGPLQYDLASLLYSPKTGLNEAQREVMLEYYLNHLDGYIKVNHDEFREFYYSFVLIRILQALGAMDSAVFMRKN
jgi:aminoglycoside/choline kinase family phosphotransferase